MRVRKYLREQASFLFRLRSKTGKHNLLGNPPAVT